MGCNTSKESVPPPDAQDKEKQENGDVKADEGKPENAQETVQEKEKSSSAKTITLRGSSTPNSPSQQAVTPEADSVSRNAEASEEEAATKIQAAFRGHQTRKSMKQPDKSGAAEPSQEQLQEEFRADDAELCHAATKIQASFRGHMTRKQIGKDDTSSQEAEKNSNNEELDIDLSDPELNKAAVKIQASFRGHMARKDEDNSDKSTH